MKSDPQTTKCTCDIVRKSIRPVEHNESCPVVADKTLTTLTCDQVAWIKDALDRRDFTKSKRFPRISRIEQMADAAFMLELCEILGVTMGDDAKHNATPRELRPACCQGDAINVA